MSSPCSTQDSMEEKLELVAPAEVTLSEYLNCPSHGHSQNFQVSSCLLRKFLPDPWRTSICRQPVISVVWGKTQGEQQLEEPSEITPELQEWMLALLFGSTRWWIETAPSYQPPTEVILLLPPKYASGEDGGGEEGKDRESTSGAMSCCRSLLERDGYYAADFSEEEHFRNISCSHTRGLQILANNLEPCW